MGINHKPCALLAARDVLYGGLQEHPVKDRAHTGELSDEQFSSMCVRVCVCVRVCMRA